MQLEAVSIEGNGKVYFGNDLAPDLKLIIPAVFHYGFRWLNDKQTRNRGTGKMTRACYPSFIVC